MVLMTFAIKLAFRFHKMITTSLYGAIYVASDHHFPPYFSPMNWLKIIECNSEYEKIVIQQALQEVNEEECYND